ncbi:MAG: class I SAM-dependent methyltransferase [Planctomycetota bacterium]
MTSAKSDFLTPERQRVERKWSAPKAAQQRRAGRFRNARRERRDVRTVERLLTDHAPGAVRVLDVPCGAGRLAPAIRSRGAQLVACDISASMVAAARGSAVLGVRGDSLRLPFRDQAFDAVVCCRLLHHFAERALVEQALFELLRISRGPVLASYWTRASWPGWRRRLRLSRPDRGGRVERSEGDFERAVAAAGGRVAARIRPAGWLSNQVFAVVVAR